MDAQDNYSNWCYIVWTVCVSLTVHSASTGNILNRSGWGSARLCSAIGEVRSDCLVSVSNSTDGLRVTITCDEGAVGHRQNFTGSYLSPLSTNEVWVENLTSEDDASVVHYALFLPLEREVGVLELQYSSHTEQWTAGFTELEGIDKPCQILFTQIVKNALYSVCIYPKDGSMMLELYEIHLNTTSPQDSSVQLESFVDFEPFDVFTNVIYADRGRDGGYNFYVIRDNRVSSIAPIEHEQRTSSALHFGECVNLTCTSLYYIQPDNLLIHCQCCNQTGCTPYGIYYDTYEENGIQSMNGRLTYHCSDFKTKVTYHSSTRQFSVQYEDSEDNFEFELEGDGFQEALCSGNLSNVWFAYQDKTGHVFAIDLSSGTNNPTPQIVSDSSCLQGPNCRPISNVSDVLMIQGYDETSGQVFAKGIDLFENYSVLFEVIGPQPNFFTLLSVPANVLQPSNNKSSSYYSHIISPTLTPTPTQMMNTDDEASILVPVLVSCLAIIIIGAAVLTLAILSFLLWKR